MSKPTNLLVTNAECCRPSVWLIQNKTLTELQEAVNVAPELHHGVTQIVQFVPEAKDLSSFGGIKLARFDWNPALTPAAAAFKKFLYYTQINGHIQEDEVLLKARRLIDERLAELLSRK